MLDDSTSLPADRPPPDPPRAAKGDSQSAPSAAPAKNASSASSTHPNADAKTKAGQNAGKNASKSDNAAKPANSATAESVDKAQACQAVITAAKSAMTKTPTEAGATDTDKTTHEKPSDSKTADATDTNDATAAACPAPVVIQQVAANAVAAAIAPAADAAAPQAPAAKDDGTAAPVAAGVAAVTLPNLSALKVAAAKDGGTQSADKPADASKTTVKAPEAKLPDPTQGAASDAAGASKVADPQATDGNAGKTVAVHPHDGSPEHRTDTADIAVGTSNADTAAAKAADAAQPLTAAAPNSQPAPTQAAAPPPAQAAAIPVTGIAVEIAGKALAGKNRFEIRLDPPELGRIDVRLDVDKNGQVTSHLTVDRADTLDLLRRDASGLERALQDAGLKTSDNGLQFSLRDQSSGQQQANVPMPAAAQIVVEDDTLSTAAIPRSYARYAGMGSGIDIRV